MAAEGRYALEHTFIAAAKESTPGPAVALVAPSPSRPVAFQTYLAVFATHGAGAALSV